MGGGGGGGGGIGSPVYKKCGIIVRVDIREYDFLHSVKSFIHRLRNGFLTFLLPPIIVTATFFLFFGRGGGGGGGERYPRSQGRLINPINFLGVTFCMTAHHWSGAMTRISSISSLFPLCVS